MERHCVYSRTLVKEEALAHWGLLHQKQTKPTSVISGKTDIWQLLRAICLPTEYESITEQ